MMGTSEGRTCLGYPSTSQVAPVHLLIALSKSIINNKLSQCINTSHALVKDRDRKTTT